MQIDEGREWFPTLYVYADEYDSIWKRLISKRFCKKIMPLFGVCEMREFKDVISKCTQDDDYRYPGTRWGSVRSILSWIKLEDIGTLP